MTPSRITLRVTQGTLQGREFVFEGPTWCVIGRGEDCTIRLPSDPAHACVSRQHCLIEIIPPTVRLRDLGSLNGTFVNGKKIGQRPTDAPPEETVPEGVRTLELKDGDEIGVGHTIFRIAVAGSAEVQEVSFPMQARQR